MKVLEELKERKVLTSIDIQYRRNLYYWGVYRDWETDRKSVV